MHSPSVVDILQAVGVSSHFESLTVADLVAYSTAELDLPQS